MFVVISVLFILDIESHPEEGTRTCNPEEKTDTSHSVEGPQTNDLADEPQSSPAIVDFI